MQFQTLSRKFYSTILILPFINNDLYLFIFIVYEKI